MMMMMIARMVAIDSRDTPRKVGQPLRYWCVIGQSLIHSCMRMPRAGLSLIGGPSSPSFFFPFSHSQWIRRQTNGHLAISGRNSNVMYERPILLSDEGTSMAITW